MNNKIVIKLYGTKRRLNRQRAIIWDDDSVAKHENRVRRHPLT